MELTSCLSLSDIYFKQLKLVKDSVEFEALNYNIYSKYQDQNAYA